MVLIIFMLCMFMISVGVAGQSLNAAFAGLINGSVEFVEVAQNFMLSYFIFKLGITLLSTVPQMMMAARRVGYKGYITTQRGIRTIILSLLAVTVVSAASLTYGYGYFASVHASVARKWDEAHGRDIDKVADEYKDPKQNVQYLWYTLYNDQDSGGHYPKLEEVLRYIGDEINTIESGLHPLHAVARLMQVSGRQQEALDKVKMLLAHNSIDYTVPLVERNATLFGWGKDVVTSKAPIEVVNDLYVDAGSSQTNRDRQLARIQRQPAIAEVEYMLIKRYDADRRNFPQGYASWGSFLNKLYRGEDGKILDWEEILRRVNTLVDKQNNNE